MADFNVRSDAVNVEQIMEQIRARIREKRGVDYTEQEIRELASVKLEKFLDPRGVRSDLLEQFRRAQPPYSPPELPNYAFEAETLFESTRGPLRFIRRLLLPILKLFFNPNPLIQALNIQSKLNASAAEREARRDAARYAFDQLHYEVMHNLVIEATRLGIEVKNLKMRLESLSSRLEFNERRARALESVVVYKPAQEERSQRQESRREESRRVEESRRGEETRRGQESRRGEESRRAEEPRRGEEPQRPETAVRPADVVPPAAADAETSAGTSADETSAAVTEGPGQRSRRRRRRRGRRAGGSAAVAMGAAAESGASAGDEATDSGSELETDDADAISAVEHEEREPESGVADSRTARPEPFEHTFGAQAHPAETAASDPGVSSPPVASSAAAPEEPAAPEPSAEKPTVTPEQ